MFEKIKELFDLKSFVTICFTGTLCYLTIMGKIDNKDFIAICMMVYTYYFTKAKRVE